MTASVSVLGMERGPALAASTQHKAPHKAAPRAPAPVSGAMPRVRAAPPVAVAPREEALNVTARRRTERLTDVPVAVYTIKSSEIATLTAAGDDIRALAARTPSLNIESSFGRTFPRTYIRGLGNPNFDTNSAQPVALYYDDVVLDNPVLRSFPLFDLANTEVLAGPQGTLFGRNTPAGVISIHSRGPEDRNTGYISQSYGTYSSAVTQGVGNVVLVPHKFAIRLSIINQRRDNWVRNTYDGFRWRKGLEGYEDIAGRLQGLYTIDDTANILFEINARHLEGTATVFRANLYEHGYQGIRPGYDINQVSQNGNNAQTLTTAGGHIKATKNFSHVGLQFISSWTEGSLNSIGSIDGGSPGNVPFSVETGTAAPKISQITQEFRAYTIKTGKFFDQAGVYYFNEFLDDYDANFNSNTMKTTELANQRQNENSVGVFDSASYDILKSLSLSAGVRYTYDFKRFSAARALGGDGPIASSESARSNNISWDVGLNYKITPDMSVYFRAATGFLAPSFQGRLTSGDHTSRASAERNTSFEIGYKANLAHGRVQLTADAYMWDTKNMQLTAAGGTSNQIRLLNADHVVGRGFEWSAVTYPIENLSVDANMSYNFTEIQSPGLESSACGVGCTMQNPIDPHTGFAEINGNALPYAPRWIANLNVSYRIPLNETQRFVLSSDWSWRSQEFFTLYKSYEFEGRPLLLGGASLAFEDTKRHLQASVFVRNITNKVVGVGALDFDNYTGYINDPRIVGGLIRYSF
ncbi:TonB-dependent receptor [Gluconacetobacter sacchari]|uniref:TonB-dependent receptor n=2 Tax=Gluconacetobacter sacchari TaxID=92759 RepID=A0A7W4IFR1_9PROT|nr:TonB-dependent receptor [Gluconacetobacter sacchari]MBB2162061.1 TonB-dependent receptor [Gluconacetobacter sacchari]